MKKGFTLAELLGVIVILLAILLIAIPVVDRSIKKGQEELYEKQIESIKSSLATWTSMNQKPNVGEAITISLSQLKDAGLVDVSISNPITKKYFPNDTLLTITNNDGILEYDVLFVSDETTIREYEILPKLTLNGDVLEYVELGSSYEIEATDGVLGKYVKVENGKIIEDIPNLSVKGNYLIMYSKEENGVVNTIFKTIVVRDTTSPTINFSDISLSINNLSTYDFNDDVVLSDNDKSNITLEVDTSNLPAKKGTYSIKYTATDASGNKTTKYRKVTIY